MILVKIVLKHLESRYNFIAKILRRKICLNDLSIEIFKSYFKILRAERILKFSRTGEFKFKANFGF